MQIEIIVNPIAGGGNSTRALETVKEILDRRNENYSTHWTRFPGHGKEIAAELGPRSETIVAVGGDGTVMEVLNGVKSSETRVGIIPAGMGNDLARCLGIPEEVTEATEVLINGEPIKVDLGEDDGELFNFMGVGFPADVVRNVEKIRNGFTRGKPVYLIGLLRSIGNLSSYEVKLEVDGDLKAKKANAVFIASCRYTGGGIDLIPHADHRDGLLDVAVIKEVGRVELVMALRKVYNGNHVNHPKIEFFRARSVNLDSPGNLTEMLDGDLKGSTPSRLTAVPEARSIIIPSNKASH